MEGLFSPPPPRPLSPSTAGPTTDFALIESQKENIRPLASGRSAATLSSVFKEPSAADRVLQEGHESHRKDIEEAERRDKEGEDMVDGVQDVLDVYNRYILFVVQHHPSSDTHLLPLIETTTRRFISDARYTQDVRYLKLWVMYARQIERREEIWAFLESRDIGTRHSVFYEEWASALEGLGRRKKADEIYRLGIARKASPLDRLKNRHKQFLERIMAPPSGVVPDDEPTSQPLRTPGRSVLGQVASGSLSVSGATQLAPSMRTTSRGNGSKMEVFSDAAGQTEESAPGEWADFGTRDARRKENTVDAVPWKGETLPQSAARARVAPRTPKVEVFKDVSDNEHVRAASEVFARFKQPPTEAELLKTDPLRHYDTTELSTAIPSLPAPPSARKPSKPAKNETRFVMKPWECPKDGPEVKGNGGKVERRMFDWATVFKGDDEWSFEEVRARQRGLLGKEWRGEVKEWERSWHQPGSTTPKPKQEKVKLPSPTVNTKLANEEIMRMFDQTIHGGKIKDSDSESDSEDDDDDVEPIQTAPTPLPTRTSTISMLALTPGGVIPPTPTPASGYVTQNRPLGASTMEVFSDENAVPPSASKPGKFNIFSETPAKTPLAAKTPMASSSSSKPRAFGIFSDDENAMVDATPSAKPRQPLASTNVFAATPAVSTRGQERLALAPAILEEEEEGVEEANEQDRDVEQVVEQTAQVTVNEVGDESVEMDDRPRGMRRFQINTMTPITERTCEYTQMTALRSSTTNIFSTTNASASRSSGIEDEGDDAFVASHPSRVIDGLTAVEEDSPSGAGSANQSLLVPLDFDKSHSPDDLPSGDVEAGFQLPEGFTIHNDINSNSMHTMVLVDGMETMHTTREGSVEPTTETFVTASLPQPTGLPNPCNPASEAIKTTILSTIEPPLSALPGYVDCTSTVSDRLGVLQKYAKSKVRRASTSSRSSIAPGDDTYALDLQGRAFEIRDKIGEGGFGAVFMAVDVATQKAQDDQDSDDEDEEERPDMSLVAIKVEQPSSVWEAVVLDRIHNRLEANLCDSIVRSRNLYAFKDESYLLLDYFSQGTLLDLVNRATVMGIAPSTSISGGPSAVDELLAIFFTIELLKLVEGLHLNQFIHGDLKIDNCLVRLEESSSWPPNYSSSSSSTDGWSKKGIKLIDFGRAIDLSLYPAKEKQTFVVDWKTDERDCHEMREGIPWNYQTDYFGLAGICYCLLFGKYMGTEVIDGKRKIDSPLKRYWQQSLWNKLFDALLNPGPSEDLPITNQLTSIRKEFEEWLEENCQKGGKSLKSLLKKVELAAIKRRA